MRIHGKLSDNLQNYYLVEIDPLLGLKVKRLGEGGTQTFDDVILLELCVKIKGCQSN